MLLKSAKVLLFFFSQWSEALGGTLPWHPAAPERMGWHGTVSFLPIHFSVAVLVFCGLGILLLHCISPELSQSYFLRFLIVSSLLLLFFGGNGSVGRDEFWNLLPCQLSDVSSCITNFRAI